MASTSSSSFFISSSSSSIGLSSGSSSSSGYCQYPDCVGVNCYHFINWLLDGAKPDNTTSGKLYAIFNNIGVIQQVELYSDPNYYNLVAIGQDGPGIIYLYERNSSGISGEVTWDGTLVSYSLATLYCEELSSSSSSSSVDSSSSSSQSSLSSSSSTSNCCLNPYCDGPNSQYFSAWQFSGMNDGNSASCKLYVGLDNNISYQQVWIYKDAELSNLVAIGQGASGFGPISITLYAVNSSGLSGSVIWNGTNVYYPNVLYLSCNPFSSSSSYSSFSFSSSSSSFSSISSASSSSNSSSSSTSVSSMSSGSTSSSSSSSSIDSSSTSSESEGNVSTSSSSSGIVWNTIKPVIFGHSAISGGAIANRMAQSFSIEKNLVSIYKVYCYLFGPYGDKITFNIALDVYTCSADEKPQTLIASSLKLGTEITGDGWYEFVFNTSEFSVPNQYLSFVMRQEGGDENNYVLWSYVEDTDFEKTKSFISSDGTIWQELDNTVFALKVIEESSVLFDLVNQTVNTEPAKEKEAPQDLGVITGEYDGTKLITDPSRVVMDYPNLLVSFIMDSSGSMGWNDRFDNRINFANTFINHMSSHYPSEILYDIIKFGSTEVDKGGFKQVGKVMRINLDARVPTRTNYVFTTKSVVNIVSGAVYLHNGYEYVASQSASNSLTVAMVGTEVPLDSGILVRQSGSGDNDVEFSSVRTISVDDSLFVSCGFKNLKNDRVYNIGSVQIDDVDISAVDSTNWQMFYPNAEHPEIVVGQNGPSGENSLDLTATTSVVLRNALFTRTVSVANISTSVTVGDLSVEVSNVSSFSIDQRIDLVDGNSISYDHTITNTYGETSTIDFTPSATSDIKGTYDGNGIIQESGIYNLYKVTGTTIMLLVRDVFTTSSEKITFFMQTNENFMIEWDFTPHPEWYLYNFNWLSETAKFYFTLNDIYGEPLDNGTRVDIEIDKRNQTINEPTVTWQNISEATAIGETKIYVESLEGFTKDQVVNIIDEVNIQQSTIEETGVDENGSYIKLYEPLQFIFDPDKGAKVIAAYGEGETTNEDKLVAAPLSMVDVTPIFAGRILPPEDLQPYDAPQIDPSTTYDELNYDIEHIRNSISNLPTIDGKAIIRVLPITEDFVKTIEDKDADLERLLILEPPKLISSQEEQNEGDIASIEIALNTTSVVVKGDDYTVETPVYSYAGQAKSNMTSSATEFKSVFLSGLNLPGGSDSIFARTYTIFPSILARTETGVNLIRLYMDSFLTYFAPQYYINSERDGQTVNYWCYNGVGECNCAYSSWEKVVVGGVHASSGKSYKINYTVTDKFTLMKSGSLRIRLYSNQVSALENIAAKFGCEEDAFDKYGSMLGINIKKADIETIVDGVPVSSLSDIDKWRKAVANNPFSIMFENQSGLGNGDASSNSESFVNSYSQVSIDKKLAPRAFGLIPCPIDTDGNEDTPPVCPDPAIFYNNAIEWSVAGQFSFTDITIDIVNGKAELEIPASNVSALIFVEASYEFGEGLYETIRGDLVFFANPLSVEPISPNYITVKDETKTYEIGVNITWMDNAFGYIDPNGTTISFKRRDGGTNISPTVSIPEDGVAKGIFVGPHRVFYDTHDQECPLRDTELVDITVSSPTGYVYGCTRTFDWLPIEEAKDKFVFKITQDDDAFVWTDGGAEDQKKIYSDLNDGYNREILGYNGGYRYWVGDDGVNRMLGEGQDDELARPVSIKGPVYAIVPFEVQQLYNQSSFRSAIDRNTFGLSNSSSSAMGLAWGSVSSAGTATNSALNAQTSEANSAFYASVNASSQYWDTKVKKYLSTKGYSNANSLTTTTTNIVSNTSSDIQTGTYASIIAQYTGKSSTAIWDDEGKIILYTELLNKNIGWPLKSCDSPYQTYGVSLDTSYVNSENIVEFGIGSICPPPPPDPDAPPFPCLPSVTYKEPLAIEMFVESTNGVFIRNGIDSPNVVAYITWKDRAIKETFTYNKGTSQESSITYPMPKVTFKAGIESVKNNKNPDDPCPELLDQRCPLNDCLSMKTNKNINLTDYVVQTGFFRTDIFNDPYPLTFPEDINNIHYHKDYNVDDAGNGITSRAIILKGSIADHTHKIILNSMQLTLDHYHSFAIAPDSKHSHESFIDNNGNGTTGEPIIMYGSVASHTHQVTNYLTDYQLNHAHEISSVAVTKIKPTTEYVNFVINGYVPYDPTNAQRNASQTFWYPYPEGVNRLMYRTLNITGIPTKPELVLNIYSGPNLSGGVISSNAITSTTSASFVTAKTPNETNRGFDIAFDAYFTAYLKEDPPGYFVNVPQRPVDDGTRISITLDAYKPKENINKENLGEVLIMDPKALRDYLVLKIEALVVTEEESVEKKTDIRISSILQWMPSVKSLYSDASDNVVAVTNSLSKINSMGSSQMYDAIRLSAKRIVDLQASNTVIENHSKVIFLFSDADENKSEYTLDQAVKSVSAINGVKKTPLTIIRLGMGYSADEITMLKLSEETNGSIRHCKNMSTTAIYEMIKQYLVSSDVKFNKGTYSASFNTANKVLPVSATLKDVISVPVNTQAEFRVRTSKDGSTWSTWSDWKNYSETEVSKESLDNLASYFEYEIKIVGNVYFNAPVLNDGLPWKYLEPKETTIFFNPIVADMTSLEYLSSIAITHQAVLPETSIIEYGVTQSDSSDINDYKINSYTGGELLSPDKQEIMLSRYNELLKTDNYKTYYASNNRWAKTIPIEIYKFNETNLNGIKIDSSLYSSNPEEGSITFIYQQDSKDSFMLCVGFEPVFRVLCKTTNYGEKTATIDHIGLIYNIMKRIPLDNSGNIVNQTIGNRI